MKKIFVTATLLKSTPSPAHATVEVRPAPATRVLKIVKAAKVH